MGVILGALASGEMVYDRPRSHLHAGVRRLLSEALATVDANGQGFLVVECDLGRIIGQTNRVTTYPGDTIVYAQRVGRRGLSRFVKNRHSEPSRSVTVVLKRDERDAYYVLLSAWIGTRAEPEPWDANATERSVTFWNSQALIWESEDVVPGTEQIWCPW